MYISTFSGESQEIHDAELSARVLRLINVTDSGLRSQVRSNFLLILSQYSIKM